MRLISYHGDGSRHREWLDVQTTADPWAFVIPAGRFVREADGSTWSSPYFVVAMFWPQRYYQVFMLLKPSGTEYYCNIITPPAYRAQMANGQGGAMPAVEFFDLDLDVYVSFEDGQPIVKQLDQEEFDQRRTGYPREWVTGALAGNEQLLRLAQEGRGPFPPATAKWWRDRIRQR